MSKPFQSSEATRARLVAERALIAARVDQLERNLGAIIESGDLDPPDDEHDPEGHTIGFERAFALGLLSQARNHLDGLDEALQRLDTGSYGVCERCGRPIGPQRLRARPDATTCITCATTSR